MMKVIESLRHRRPNPAFFLVANIERGRCWISALGLGGLLALIVMWRLAIGIL